MPSVIDPSSLRRGASGLNAGAPVDEAPRAFIRRTLEAYVVDAAAESEPATPVRPSFLEQPAKRMACNFGLEPGG